MTITEKLKQYQSEMEAELKAILAYWMHFAPDEMNRGFYGKIDNNNNVFPHSPKGSVLNARILWSFSAAYNLTREPKYLAVAQNAYDYIVEYFIDKEYGGVFWTVDYIGVPADTKKQVYAIAFFIYACSEYYKSCQLEEVKQAAIHLYQQMERYSYDTERTGYYEAFTREWNSIDDVRLSAKDANEKKTMNTHLHVLEAYANLYTIWPNDSLKQRITQLIENFTKYFIDNKSFHLQLFFDEQWNRQHTVVSYGHDIEAAWLLLDAAEIIGKNDWVGKLGPVSLQLTNAAAEGLDKDGGLWYEMENGKLVKEKHWWPQAEAMVGFFNAWQLSGAEQYLDASLASWEFIKKKILDKVNGEWYWGITDDDKPMEGFDKAGLWKCPYHNSRACMELIKRIADAANLPENHSS